MCPWLKKSSQSNFNLQSPGSLAGSYLITTVIGKINILKRIDKKKSNQYLKTTIYMKSIHVKFNKQVPFITTLYCNKTNPIGICTIVIIKWDFLQQ